jgi:toxin ParE1/3/4
MRLKISREAKRDLLAIARFGTFRFGRVQSQTYSNRLTQAMELLAQNPEMARIREGYGRQVRIHPVGAHAVVYEIVEDVLTVTRVLHGHQNWIDHI